LDTFVAPNPSGTSLAFNEVERRATIAAAAATAELACSAEPIHIPGTIQPHGVLLALEPSRDWTVAAVSHNAAELLPAFLSTGEVIGSSTESILGSSFAMAVQSRFQNGELREKSPWQSMFGSVGSAPLCNVTVHSHAGLVLVELERASVQDGADAQAALHQLQDIIVNLRETGNELKELARVVARGIRRLTGYERVLVYRFDTDWHGQAIAEDKVAGWDNSLSGLRFPAADIPAQARALYARSPMRWVADRDATPVPLDIDPAWMDEQGQPRTIDLSFARLRSPSPVHLQIHRNLNINGFMSLSILHQDRLWGLMVCHHRNPHQPSFNQRSAAAALTDAFALRVGPAERVISGQARRDDLVRLSTLLAGMAEADVVATALTTGDVTVGSLFAATGAAVLHDGTFSLVGNTPPEAEVRDLAAWLRKQGGAAKLFQTNNLAAVYPPWERHSAVASGLLAVFLSADQSDMLLWFRAEEPQLVSWGSGSHMRTPKNAISLPRPSFEQWAETRHGSAKPWAEWELEMAETLRHGITEVLVRSLRRITELHDKLRQSQKMEAVGQLTGGIAHDFNNLLAGILGSLELMQLRVAQGRPGDINRYIGTAMTSANRAASLTHRLLAFSRRQTLDSKVVDVNRLATSMEDLIRRTVGPAIHVETVISGGLWKTLCDANQLENALLNLAINARDAMPEGGRLTIEATNARLDDAYAGRHHEVAAGQYVAVSVTDTGSGMAPDVIAHVFEPFFTTQPSGQGTGLGLSMVYGFTKQSNGFASIYSEVGHGTTVRLYLPRHFGDDVNDENNPDLPPAAAVKVDETVLVVDDEPAVRMLVSDVLGDLGYDVIEAADGAGGLRILQSKQRVNLLVSDVGLPGGMNGRQLADAARVYRPELRVLFITGYAENAALGNGVLSPGMQVLTKPFALDVLAAKVQTMMA
jgi:light-regulated signal transduction histidine kinase (bacteriophytochrome)